MIKREGVVGTKYTQMWSVGMDGCHILALVASRPKMSYAEILQIIHNEGGYVDKDGIVHKGTCKNIVYKID